MAVCIAGVSLGASLNLASRPQARPLPKKSISSFVPAMGRSWLFFNQFSFRPDDQGCIFLDDALTQSRAYAVAPENDLRDDAYRSLEQLIIGFKPFGSPKAPEVAGEQAPLFDESAFTRDPGLAVKGVALIEGLPTLDIETVYAND
jgi:hypothetical protein